MECDEEWAMNKKVVDLSSKNIRQAVSCVFFPKRNSKIDLLTVESSGVFDEGPAAVALCVNTFGTITII